MIYIYIYIYIFTLSYIHVYIYIYTHCVFQHTHILYSLHIMFLYAYRSYTLNRIYHGFCSISLLRYFVKRLFPDANTNNALREFKLQVDTLNAGSFQCQSKITSSKHDIKLKCQMQGPIISHRQIL